MHMYMLPQFEYTGILSKQRIFGTTCVSTRELNDTNVDVEEVRVATVVVHQGKVSQMTHLHGGVVVLDG